MLNKLKHSKFLRSMQGQLFIAFVVVLTVLILLFSFIFYAYSSTLLIEAEKVNLETMLTSVKDAIESNLQEMDSVSTDIVYSNVTQEQLSDVFNLDKSDTWSQYSEIKKLTELFVAINGTSMPVDQLNIYDFNGNVAKLGFNNTMESNVVLEDFEWYEDTIAKDGYKYISKPYIMSDLNPQISNDNYYVSLLRVYSNKYGSGIIETISESSLLFHDILKLKNTGCKIFIYNQDKEQIYPYFQDAMQAEYSLLKNSKEGVVLGADKYIAKENHSRYTDFTYFALMPEKIILKPVENLKFIIALVLVFAIVCIVFLAYVLSKRFTTPIKKMHKIIESTELNSLGNVEEFNASFDEIDKLYQEFVKMGYNLQKSVAELVETKRQALKSKILALQSQINPHFYYNTLANIIALSTGGQNEKVVKMCRNMTEMMRYVVDNTGEVPLIKEAEYLSKYLYCMQVRYPTTLEYEISIPKEMEEITVPRLIIQPLVENALKYGADKTGRWTIKVQGEITQESWSITVYDSGKGFSEESVKIINSRMENAKATTGMPDIHLDGMGLLNVYLRFKLYFGENSFFKFGTAENVGGFVTIGKKLTGDTNEQL